MVKIQRSRQEIRWFLRIYLMVALGVCVYSLYLAAMSLVSLGWPVVSGEIVSSRFLYTDASDWIERQFAITEEEWTHV